MNDLLFFDRLFTFNWIIKNFSFICPDRYNPLCSPYFNLNVYGNACIQLYPEGDLFSEECLLLEIKVPNKLENILIDCELSGYDLNGKALEFLKTVTNYRKRWKFKRVAEKFSGSSKKDNETSVESGTECNDSETGLESSSQGLESGSQGLESGTQGFQMHPARFKWPPEKGSKNKETVSDDTLIITCIFHQLKMPLGNKCSMDDVEHLSQDVSLLLQSSQWSDLLLCAGSETFYVHKAILWARAPKFSNDLNLQKWKVSSVPVKVDLDPAVLRLLLEYLYSGKLKTDKAEYLAILCRIANTYDLVDLKQKLYVFPTENCITTNIKVDRKSFMWHLNFKSPEEKFSSPTFHSGCVPGSEFRLILSVCRDSSGVRNVKVCIRRLFPDKDNPVFLHFKISLIGPGKRIRLSDTKQHYFLTDKEWCFSCFVSLSSEWFLKQDHIGNRFYLQCDLTVSGGESSVLEKSFCSSNSGICNITDLFCYGQDLKKLFNIFLPKFSDCILRVGEVRYPAHRAVLSARSLVFSRMFTECVYENRSNTIEIIDVEPAILNIILVYLYSGIVEELDYVNAIKIYNVASKYQIVSLKNAVAFFLKSKIEIKNIFELLRLTDICSDDILKKCIIDFISSNPQHVLALDDWDYFITFNTTLASEILHKTNHVILSKLNE